MTTTSPTTRPRTGIPWTDDAAAIAASVLCALIAWFFVAELPGVDLLVDAGGQVRQIGASDVAVAAAVSSLAGFCFLRLLERITVRALTLWTVIAIAVALLSMFGTAAAMTRTSTFALVSLHSVVAVVVIVAARRSRSACLSAT